MPLLDIITELSEETGKDIVSGRDWLVRLANAGAKELYDSDDILGCEREKTFNVGSSDQQLTLPWYVQDIIAARNYDTREHITLNDMRPRYASSSWTKPFLRYPYYTWRKKGEIALTKNLSQEAALTVTLPLAADEAFEVIIVGSNASKSKFSETLVFSVGDLTKTTTNFFGDVTAIRKNKTISANLTITDASGNTVSFVANCELAARHLIVQILERGEQMGQDVLVDVLYKQRFIPMHEDYDTFVAGDTYDKAIYWKSLEHYYSKLDGKEEKAAMCGAKASAVLANIIATFANNIEMKIEFGSNPTFNAFELAKADAFNTPSNLPRDFGGGPMACNR